MEVLTGTPVTPANLFKPVIFVVTFIVIDYVHSNIVTIKGYVVILAIISMVRLEMLSNTPNIFRIKDTAVFFWPLF